MDECIWRYCCFSDTSKLAMKRSKRVGDSALVGEAWDRDMNEECFSRVYSIDPPVE